MPVALTVTVCVPTARVSRFTKLSDLATWRRRDGAAVDRPTTGTGMAARPSGRLAGARRSAAIAVKKRCAGLGISVS